jgi:hypothetical protein
MQPQTCLRSSRTAWFSSLPLQPIHRSGSIASCNRRPIQALRLFSESALSLLCLALVQGHLNAQQPWPQAGQYAPQPGYPQPQVYAQPQYQQPTAPQQYQQPSPPPAQQYPQQDYGQAPAPAQPLDAQQLEQLVAPIALYPDALVAQVLAAATYPAQVVAADHWLQTMGNAPPDQVAYGADTQSWDPSVKALTAFPQVLTELDQNLQWTTDLGNAYYNEPQDVLQTVQVMRQRAQAAGTLQTTPQQAVSYNQGYIAVAPVNPQVVYVPTYNPWTAYGQPVAPYHGFSLLSALGSIASFASGGRGSSGMGFGLGTVMSAFSHTPWGWLAWGLNWLSQSVLFNNSTYSTQSTSVANWGSSRGGGRSFAGSGGNPRLPGGSHPIPYGDGRQNNGSSGPSREGFARPEDRFAGNRQPEYPSRGYQSPGSGPVRPALDAYNRAPQPIARPQQYSRPGYGSGFTGGQGSAYPARPAAPTYANRPGSVYGSTAQAYRPQAPAYARNDFAGRSQQSFAGNSFAAPSRKQERAISKENSKMFGGGYKPEKFHGGHEPKSHGGGHSGGGGHSHGHLFGGHSR